MDHITLVLDLLSLQNLMQGKDIVFTSDDGTGIPIVVTCDVNTTQAMRAAVHMAMLNLLPPAPGVH
jgi:hypothetical protein